MSKTLTICMIMGLGEEADKELLGMRDCLIALTQKYGAAGVGFLAFEHNQDDLHDIIMALPGDVILAGHSNGGEEVHRIDALFYSAGRSAEAELYMDPKPKWDSFGQVVAWMNPAYQYTLPLATVKYYDYFSGFGRPLLDLKNSEKLDIAHPDFPADPRCQAKLEEMVKAWVDEQPPAPTQTVTT